MASWAAWSTVKEKETRKASKHFKGVREVLAPHSSAFLISCHLNNMQLPQKSVANALARHVSVLKSTFAPKSAKYFQTTY